MGFVLQMVNFVFKMMNYVLKLINFRSPAGILRLLLHGCDRCIINNTNEGHPQ